MRDTTNQQLLPVLSKSAFGEDFQWGVSTAAYQIEGAHEAEGKGLSIWDVFSAKKGKIRQRHHGNHACDFFNRYPDDLELMQSMAIPNFRFSLSWSRLLPAGTGHLNQHGVAYYDRLIDHCLELGITPWLTLYHWDLPHELEKKGGWANRDIVDWLLTCSWRTCLRMIGVKIVSSNRAKWKP